MPKLGHLATGGSGQDPKRKRKTADDTVQRELNARLYLRGRFCARDRHARPSPSRLGRDFWKRWGLPYGNPEPSADGLRGSSRRDAHSVCANPPAAGSWLLPLIFGQMLVAINCNRLTCFQDTESVPWVIQRTFFRVADLPTIVLCVLETETRPGAFRHCSKQSGREDGRSRPPGSPGQDCERCEAEGQES